MTSVTAHAALLSKRETVLLEHLSLAESGPRVEAVIHGLEARLQHVRVNLRGRQIGVAEHHLDRAQVGAALEQMRREGVPQGVRAERAREPGRRTMALEDLPEAHA